MPPTIIKKYGNRRLYDTGDSRYVTLEELAAKIRSGTDVRVVDAQTGDDLTQSTLTQIILESGSTARLLPVGLLTQLVRLDDDSLAEFFGRYVTGALEMYLQARRGVAAVAQVNPLAQLPITAGDALARLWMASPFGQAMGPLGFGGHQPQHAPPPAPAWTPEPPPHPDDEPDDRRRDEQLAALRRELDELKRSAGKPSRRKKTKS
jgi:polyhydroxyalkanoate synthesis repressor PhaR